MAARPGYGQPDPRNPFNNQPYPQQAGFPQPQPQYPGGLQPNYNQRNDYDDGESDHYGSRNTSTAHLAGNYDQASEYGGYGMRLITHCYNTGSYYYVQVAQTTRRATTRPQ